MDWIRGSFPVLIFKWEMQKFEIVGHTMHGNVTDKHMIRYGEDMQNIFR